MKTIKLSALLVMLLTLICSCGSEKKDNVVVLSSEDRIMYKDGVLFIPHYIDSMTILKEDMVVKEVFKKIRYDEFFKEWQDSIVMYREGEIDCFCQGSDDRFVPGFKPFHKGDTLYMYAPVYDIEAIDGTDGIVFKSPFKLGRSSELRISYEEGCPYVYKWYKMNLIDKEDGKYVYSVNVDDVKHGYTGMIDEVSIVVEEEYSGRATQFTPDEFKQYFPKFFEALK